jgi:hypothetical protein
MLAPPPSPEEDAATIARADQLLRTDPVLIAAMSIGKKAPSKRENATKPRWPQHRRWTTTRSSGASASRTSTASLG